MKNRTADAPRDTFAPTPGLNAVGRADEATPESPLKPRTRVNFFFAILMILAVFTGYANWPRPIPNEVLLNESLNDRPLSADVSLEAGWRGVTATTFPQKLHSLLYEPSVLKGLVVGCRQSGGVYTYRRHGAPKSLATDLNDHGPFGSVEVNALHVADLDGEGRPELVAAVSQVLPRQPPRFYVWTLSDVPQFRGVTQPRIESSWVHGLASVASPGRRGRTLLSSFCGFGEVVELRFENRTLPDGMAFHGLSSRQAADFPISGESLGIADVTRDGRQSPQLCLALGFSEGNAQIRIYRPRPAGTGPETPDMFRAGGWNWYLQQTIEESGRFANVRMLLDDADGDGSKEIHAWWITGLHGGACEFVRYDLKPDGIHRRLIHATDQPDFWPLETQLACGDSDGDGRPEIWFASGARLWRYDESRDPAPTTIATTPEGFGPIAIATDGVYVGKGRDLLRFERQERAGQHRAPESADPSVPSSPQDQHGG
jgi:hypothetical protein